MVDGFCGVRHRFSAEEIAEFEGEERLLNWRR